MQQKSNKVCAHQRNGGRCRQVELVAVPVPERELAPLVPRDGDLAVEYQPQLQDELHGGLDAAGDGVGGGGGALRVAEGQALLPAGAVALRVLPQQVEVGSQGDHGVEEEQKDCREGGGGEW